METDDLRIVQMIPSPPDLWAVFSGAESRDGEISQLPGVERVRRVVGIGLGPGGELRGLVAEPLGFSLAESAGTFAGYVFATDAEEARRLGQSVVEELVERAPASDIGPEGLH